jgi:hypothetical protein
MPIIAIIYFVFMVLLSTVFIAGTYFDIHVILLFPTYFVNHLGISHNVPAVYDGLTARIEKCVAFLGLAKCAGATAWE